MSYNKEEKICSGASQVEVEGCYSWSNSAECRQHSISVAKLLQNWLAKYLVGNEDRPFRLHLILKVPKKPSTLARVVVFTAKSVWVCRPSFFLFFFFFFIFSSPVFILEALEGFLHLTPCSSPRSFTLPPGASTRSDVKNKLSATVGSSQQEMGKERTFHLLPSTAWMYLP